MEQKRLDYIKVKDVVDISLPGYTFNSILGKLIGSGIKVYVISEFGPGNLEWTEVDDKTIETTYLYGYQSFWNEHSERYGLENIAPDELAIAKGNIQNIWINISDTQNFKKLFKDESKSKTVSDNNQLRILEVIVDVLATELEEKCTVSALLKNSQDSRKLSAAAVIDHIRNNSARYFTDCENGELPYGFKDRSILEVISKARKN